MEYNLRISLIILLFLVLIPSSLSTNLESIEAITPASTYLNISNNLFVSSSNVGIGTSSPGQKLDVSGGNIRTTGQLISTVATGTAPLSVSSTTKVTNLNADLLDGHDTSYFMTASTDNWVNVAGDTMTGPLVMSSTYLNLNRAGAADTGIQWYSNSYNAWAEYMAPTGAGMGPKGTLTAPSGSIVTSWALRSFIENVGGYGWTWESGTSSTTTPNVVAEIRASDGLAQFDGGVRSPIFYDLDNTGYYVDPASTGNSVLAAGKVGIGTTSPQTKTHIWSGEVASGQQEVLRLEGNWITTGDGPLLRFTNQHDSGTTPNSGEYNLAGIQARDFAANWAGGLVFMTPNAGTSGGSALVDRMVIREGGNVGIGTTSPTNKLDVVGVIQVTPTVGTQKFGLYSYNNVFQLNPRNSDGSYASITGLTMDSSGNVGIDTSSPAQKLHVAGNAYVTGFLGVGSSNPVKALDVRGDAYISGNVGIGTTGPVTQLHVTGLSTFNSAGRFAANGIGFYFGDQSAAYRNPSTNIPGVVIRMDESNAGLDETKAALVLYNANGGLNTGAGLTFASREAIGAGNDVALAGIFGQKLSSGNAGGWSAGGLRFWVKNYGNIIEAMAIDNIGNVGIGTTSPADKLDVNGDVRVRGGDIKDSGGTARITFSGTNVIIRVG